MWSFPYLNRPVRGQWFTTQQAMVVGWCCVCACLVCVFVFGKLRIFLCRTSHYFSWVKKYSYCKAHLLRATRRTQWETKWSCLLCCSPPTHPHFDLSTDNKHCFYPHLKLAANPTDSDMTVGGLTIGWIWCVKASNTQILEHYPFCHTLQ